MDKEIKKIDTGPAELIAAAMKSDTDLDKLERLLILQERWEGTQAKKAYHKAMAAFKTNPPKIDKDRKVSFGNTKYSHATLANITDKINTELSKHGLSASWATQQNGAVAVTCRITHILGHTEETTLSGPADTSGSKNAIQAIGSAITYLQRYTLLALTGLAAHDMDDDGHSSVKPGKPEKETLVKPGAKKTVKKTEDKKTATLTPAQLNVKFTQLKKMLGDDDFLYVLRQYKYTSLKDIKSVPDAMVVIQAMESVFKGPEDGGNDEFDLQP